MGIVGLLKAIKDTGASKHISDYAGQTVAIDGYSWLHKGVYCCAEELVTGVPTRRHVKYFLDRCELLLRSGVTPYVVFDGDALGSKGGKEIERAASRAKSLRAAKELVARGDRDGARALYVKAVDVTPFMAYEVILALRERKIRFVVAPYEADSQLAHLYNTGAVTAVVAEDSDLLTFGCRTLFTKMDKDGHGVEFNLDNLGTCEALDLLNWDAEMLLLWSILAGCDYLTSPRGMGIITAHRCVLKVRATSVRRRRAAAAVAAAGERAAAAPSTAPPIWKQLINHVRFGDKGKLPRGYEGLYERALLTFRHQLVFDEATQRMVPLHPLDAALIARTRSAGRDAIDISFAGTYWEPAVAAGVARGELHPETKLPFATTMEERAAAKEKEAASSSSSSKAAAAPSTARNATAAFAALFAHTGGGRARASAAAAPPPQPLRSSSMLSRKRSAAAAAQPVQSFMRLFEHRPDGAARSSSCAQPFKKPRAALAAVGAPPAKAPAAARAPARAAARLRERTRAAAAERDATTANPFLEHPPVSASASVSAAAPPARSARSSYFARVVEEPTVRIEQPRSPVVAVSAVVPQPPVEYDSESDLENLDDIKSPNVVGGARAPASAGAAASLARFMHRCPNDERAAAGVSVSVRIEESPCVEESPESVQESPQAARTVRGAGHALFRQFAFCPL